jgi:hypothetical protein
MQPNLMMDAGYSWVFLSHNVRKLRAVPTLSGLLQSWAPTRYKGEALTILGTHKVMTMANIRLGISYKHLHFFLTLQAPGILFSLDNGFSNVFVKEKDQ